MKILKSRKALSPVVASIILIAVTVAVSIAVAAWMGALSFSFMGSGEQLNVGSPYGWTNTGTTVNLDVSVPGGSAVTINSVRINGTSCTISTVDGVAATLALRTIQPTAKITLGVTLPTTGNFLAFSSGYYYQFVVVTLKNHEFQTTGLVP
jgi:flagellin-like protein